MINHVNSRLSDETQEQYRQRQRESKEYNKMLRRGMMPTMFVQHNPKQQEKWKEQNALSVLQP